MSMPEPSESSGRDSSERINDGGAASGEARGPAIDVDEVRGLTAARIARANAELQTKTADLMALPIALLTAQRDQALAELEQIRAEAERRHSALVDEQDAFIAFLMAEHEAKVAEMTERLDDAASQLKRLEALQPAGTAGREADRGRNSGAAAGELERRLAEAEEHLTAVQAQLQEAYRDVDDARAETSKMQEERDDANESVERTRAEAADQLDAIREEAFALQRQIDEANRRLEDARDEARDEMYRLNEELDAARREVDERRAEVRRLRERIRDISGEAKGYSQPPPPAGGYELELARDEAKNLRKQLIDTKRELSRAARELEVTRSRPAARKIPLPVSSTNRTPPGGIGLVTAPPGFAAKPGSNGGDKDR